MKRALMNALIRTRRRVMLERLLKGMAVLILFLITVSALLSFVLSQYNFSDSAIFWSRVFVLMGAGGISWWYIFRILFRSPSISRIATFLEQRNPELQDRLSTAVEVSGASSKIHPDIRELVERDAFRTLKASSLPRWFWPQLSLGSVLAVAMSILVFLVLFLGGPGAYRYSLGKLLGNWFDREDQPLYQVVVKPGSVTVGERADLEVRASLVGFETNEVLLMAQYSGNPQWDSTRMFPVSGSPEFSFHFFDIREPIDYYVEADGIRSPEFRIDVSAVPRVEKVTVTLRFPAYTGLTEVSFDDETRISALKGTEVRLRIETDQPVKEGFLKFEEGDDIELEAVEDRALAASFKIVDDDHFRIHLANSEGVLNPGSDEFSVEALDDQKPIIRFSAPGRDQKVTNIEEVFIELKAEDDHGLARLTLNFSVNGGDEEEIALGLARGSKIAVSSHTLFLEELDLVPGDFIAYYGRARDAVSSAVTDIFFLEVEPFNKEYYQAQQSGAAGGAMNQGLELSRQQKQIIVGTFSLQEEMNLLSEAEKDESVQTLALIQQRLAAQAQTIVDRIERRGGALSEARVRQMAEYMKQSIDHMKLAEEALNSAELEKAMPEEQKAYQSLLRAEALFNEVQVAMAQNSGGQGSSPQDLADLVDLELDRTKNQYETLQQNREMQQEQAVDEALEKLKELARRQEQQLERQKRRGQSGSNGDQMSNEQMLDEIERLARELARLSRKKQDERLSRISKQLERAARDLQKASSSGQSGQKSQELAQQAMERLRQAEDALNRQRQSEVRQKFQELKDQAQRLVDEQDDVVQQMGQLAPGTNGEQRIPDDKYYDQIRELFWQKQDLQRDLQELEGGLHQSARRLESEEPDAARKLKDAGNAIRDDRIPDKMQEGSELMASGLIGLAQRREDGIANELRRLADKIQQAEQALGTGKRQDSEERLQSALEEAGRLVEGLESLKEMAEATQNQGQQPGQQQSNSEESRSEGQEGQSPSDQQASSQSGQQGSGQSQEGEGNSTSPQEGQGGIQRMASTAGAAGSTGINPQQLAREWDQRMKEAAELTQMLRENPELAREASGLLREMRNFDPSQIFDDEEEVRRLKSLVIDGFHQLELEINRALQDEDEAYLRPVSEDEIPSDFRERVEEYYRKLAEKTGNP